GGPHSADSRAQIWERRSRWGAPHPTTQPPSMLPPQLQGLPPPLFPPPPPGTSIPPVMPPPFFAYPPPTAMPAAASVTPIRGPPPPWLAASNPSAGTATKAAAVSFLDQLRSRVSSGMTHA